VPPPEHEALVLPFEPLDRLLDQRHFERITGVHRSLLEHIPESRRIESVCVVASPECGPFFDGTSPLLPR
jgi:hypothetical protein